MDNLMNNPILIKAQEFGQKLGANSYVAALQASMQSCMAPIMVGAVFTIICNVATVAGWFTAEDAIYSILYKPYDVTMNLIGLYTTMMIAFNYAKNVGCKSPLLVGVDAIAAYMLVAVTYQVAGGTDINVSYLGASGMFIGFLIAWWTVTVQKFCEAKNIKIPMPDVCPPSLVNSMSAILPLLFTFVPLMLIDNGIQIATAGAFNLCSGFLKVLEIPLGALTSVPGMFVLNFFACLLWCFGIHGTLIIISVLMPIMVEASAVNAQIYADVIAQGGTALEANQALVFYPVALFVAIAYAGGTGNTLPLCIFGALFGKSEQIKAVSKIGIVPGWFGINEPVTFGMPIMYNPILCIPYILNSLLCTLVLLLLYKFHIIYPGHIYNGALLPMGFADVITTLRWQQFFTPYFVMIFAGLVWFPFFKAYDKQLYAQEQAALAEEDED